jgi:hypothetical protein
MDDRNIKELHKILKKSNPNLDEITRNLNENDESKTKKYTYKDYDDSRPPRHSSGTNTEPRPNSSPFHSKPVIHKPYIYKNLNLESSRSSVIHHPPVYINPAKYYHGQAVLHAPLLIPPPPPPPPPVIKEETVMVKPVIIYKEKPVFIKEQAQPIQQAPVIIKEDNYYVKESELQLIQQLMQSQSQDPNIYINGDNLMIPPPPPPPHFPMPVTVTTNNSNGTTTTTTTTTSNNQNVRILNVSFFIFEQILDFLKLYKIKYLN